jgi:hypothetical protein
MTTTEFVPFTAEQFVDAAYSLELDINKTQTHARARASGLGACAREQGYSYSGTPESNPQRADPRRAPGVLTTEQGRHVEDLSCGIIDHLPQGLTVVDRQIEVPPFYPVSGHPDGRLQSTRVGSGHHTLEDGLVWGFEHKHLGRFSYMKTFKLGWEAANAGYMTQLIMYGKALGWDKATVLVLAQDASGTQFEYNNSHYAKKITDNNKWAQRTDWHPKVQLFHVDLRPWYGFFPQLTQRGDQIMKVTREQGPAAIRREGDGVSHAMFERDPGGKGKPVFPCGYCSWVDRCNLYGNGTEGIIPIPPQLGAK